MLVSEPNPIRFMSGCICFLVSSLNDSSLHYSSTGPNDDYFWTNISTSFHPVRMPDAVKRDTAVGGE